MVIKRDSTLGPSSDYGIDKLTDDTIYDISIYAPSYKEKEDFWWLTRTTNDSASKIYDITLTSSSLTSAQKKNNREFYNGIVIKNLTLYVLDAKEGSVQLGYYEPGYGSVQSKFDTVENNDIIEWGKYSKNQGSFANFTMNQKVTIKEAVLVDSLTGFNLKMITFY